MSYLDIDLHQYITASFIIKDIFNVLIVGVSLFSIIIIIY